MVVNARFAIGDYPLQTSTVAPKSDARFSIGDYPLQTSTVVPKTDARFSIGDYPKDEAVVSFLRVWNADVQDWKPEPWSVYDATNNVWSPVRPAGTPAGWVGLPVNVASGRDYSSSVGANLWDDNIETAWNTGGMSNNWCTADFGAPITATKTYLRSQGVATNWTLSGSEDNVNWTQILTGVSATLNVTTEYVFAQPYTFRFWKLHGNSTSWTDPCICSLHN